MSELTDRDLLLATRRLVGRSNQILAALLAHLGEVEARGVHRTRACASLYVYCVYDLRFSEDEAFRRVSAARLVRRFPPLLEAVAAGELHLTGLLMLGPHLTNENLSEVLARAKHRTKKEIARLVRELDPLPAVAARIDPLGPAPVRLVPKTPTWVEFTRSLCPVRHLLPGERARDWVEPLTERSDDIEGAGDVDPSHDTDSSPDAAQTSPGGLAPQRYAVQFTAGEEYVKLVEEAQALLSHSRPRVALDELHLRAMQALVTELKRKKYAETAPARKKKSEPTERATPEPLNEEVRREPSDDDTTGADPRRRVERGPCAEARGRRSRHVPAAVRRAVCERDAGRCTYTDDSGRRCVETHRLELHHLEPFAKEGEHTADNLTLHCKAHNALAAERDFGRSFMQHQRQSQDHEPWAAGTAGLSPSPGS